MICSFPDKTLQLHSLIAEALEGLCVENPKLNMTIKGVSHKKVLYMHPVRGALLLPVSLLKIL